jgi:hypothetical protein
LPLCANEIPDPFCGDESEVSPPDVPDCELLAPFVVPVCVAAPDETALSGVEGAIPFFPAFVLVRKGFAATTEVGAVDEKLEDGLAGGVAGIGSAVGH